MYKVPEIRKYVRAEKPFITKFHVKPDNSINCKELDMWDMVAVMNLSAGGIFFYAKKELEVGAILDLKIGLSLSHPSVTCSGRVIRKKRHLDTPTIGFAIEFTEIEDHVKDAINSTVQKNVEQNYQSSH